MRLDYIANVTHALKTPNASIKAMTEALCDDMIEGDDMKKVYYGKILGEINVSAGELFDDVIEHYIMLCDCTDISLHYSEAMAQLPMMYMYGSIRKRNGRK